MPFLRGGPPARPTLSASPIGHQCRCPEQTLRRPSLPVRLAAPDGPCQSPSLSVPRSALPAGPSHRSSQIGPAARPSLSAHCFGHAGRVCCPPDHSFLGGPVCRHLRSIPITRYCLTRTPMPALLIGPPDRPSLSVPDEASRTGPVCQPCITVQHAIPPWRPACSAHPVGLPDRSPISVPRSDPSSALPAGPPCRP